MMFNKKNLIYGDMSMTVISLSTCDSQFSARGQAAVLQHIETGQKIIRKRRGCFGNYTQIEENQN